MENKDKNTNRKHIAKIVIAILTLLLVVVIAYSIGRPLVRFVSDPAKFRDWVNEKGFLGVLAFISMNILQVLLAVIPGGPFEVGAGYAFGVFWGTLFCDLAMTVAGVLIFLFVRRFGMRFVGLFVSREKIESVHILKSSRRSESIIFLLFLIPGTPKDLFSYLIGLTDIRLSHWIFISAVGRLPAIFLSVLSGSALGESEYSTAVIATVILILFYVIGLIVYRYHNQRMKPSDHNTD